MIATILEVLKKGDYYGAGECTEIVKGKCQMTKDIKTFKRKLKRKIKE